VCTYVGIHNIPTYTKSLYRDEWLFPIFLQGCERVRDMNKTTFYKCGGGGKNLRRNLLAEDLFLIDITLIHAHMCLTMHICILVSNDLFLLTLL
jgi:hypothetical protein